jgi:hypothetical protein
LGNAISGATGSAVSHLLFYPIDLIITRLQIQSATIDDDAEEPAQRPYTSVSDAIQRIYTDEGGLPAFYAGATYDTLKSVADSFVFFLAYTYLRQRQSSNARTLTGELGTGIAAGAIAKLFTTPVQQIVTQKQAARRQSTTPGTAPPPPALSVAAIAARIRAERGLRGFWAGYSASLVLTLNPALTFLLQSVLGRWVGRRRRVGERVSPVTTFLLAAISKAVATAGTYPFSLAKARAQVKGAVVTRQEKGKEVLREQSWVETGLRAADEAFMRSVFGMVYLIARKEGVTALYQGLRAQVIKGFFEHGATMAMKERILRLVTRLYIMSVKP